MTNEELIAKAIDTRKNAICNFTGYSIGAVVQTKSGKVYRGVNIEHSISGVGICGERAAFTSVLSVGEREFDKLAVVGGKIGQDIDKTLIPCGVCLQYMLDFAEDITIVCYIDGEIVERKIGDFLKNAYRYHIDEK